MAVLAAMPHPFSRTWGAHPRTRTRATRMRVTCALAEIASFLCWGLDDVVSQKVFWVLRMNPLPHKDGECSVYRPVQSDTRSSWHVRTRAQSQCSVEESRFVRCVQVLKAGRYAAFEETTKWRLDEIELEFESLTAEQIDTPEVTPDLSNFHELWAQLLPKEQARLLALLIAQIDHDGRHGNVSITFHPTGIRTLMQESVDLCEVAV